MSDKKQVIIIGGGEAWDTHDEYIEYLREYDFNEEKFNKAITKRWKESLQEYLGDEYQVVKPQMPSVNNSKYEEWVIWFEKIIPYFQNDIVLVGHSLGAIFLVKYLAENTVPVSIVQVHFVAGVFGCKGGFSVPELFENIEKQCKQVFIYHSTDDFVVDFADALKFEKAIPSAKLVRFEDRGHFLQEKFSELVENIKNNVL